MYSSILTLPSLRLGLLYSSLLLTHCFPLLTHSSLSRGFPYPLILPTPMAFPTRSFFSRPWLSLLTHSSLTHCFPFSLLLLSSMAYPTHSSFPHPELLNPQSSSSRPWLTGLSHSLLLPSPNAYPTRSLFLHQWLFSPMAYPTHSSISHQLLTGLPYSLLLPPRPFLTLLALSSFTCSLTY
jgi:hypothetical protein